MYADCLPGAQVTVRVNGQALTEHATENGQLNATTFVEAVPGAQFTVNLDLEAAFAYRDPRDRLEFGLWVDGQWIRSAIVASHSLPCSHMSVGLMETKSGVSTLKRLSFAEHTSTDGHAKTSFIEKLAKVGEIQVDLRRCRENGIALPRSNGFKGVDDAIPEKALKGRSVSSHTKLEHAEKIPDAKWVSVTYPYGGVIATYVFQYRTRKDLEIEGIVERSPSPVPLIDRNPDDLTPDELREQVRLLHAARASTVKVKQEFKREKRARGRSTTPRNDGDGDGDGDVTIMSESDRRKRLRSSMEGAETIDLTGD